MKLMSQNDAAAPPKSVAEYLRPLMEGHGLTVVTLAHAAGVDVGYLRRIIDEKPKEHPTQMSIDAGIRIARVLELEPETFAVLQAQRLVFDRMQALETEATPATFSGRSRVSRPGSVRRNCKRTWGHPKP